MGGLAAERGRPVPTGSGVRGDGRAARADGALGGVDGRAPREPPLLPGPQLLSLAAREPVVAGRFDRDDGCRVDLAGGPEASPWLAGAAALRHRPSRTRRFEPGA